jgi:RimJ/RimL family protein N-acetyltransferase
VRYRSALDDGTPLLFRPITKEDRELLRDGFEHLSDAAKYTRFFRQVKHLSEEQLTYLTTVDYKSHFAWVAMVMSEPVEGIGVARWIRLVDQEDVAEVAVTVIDEFQRRGLGRTLLTLAMMSAVDAGVTAFRAWVLSDNRATLAMLRKMGAAPGRWESGVLELNVPLPNDPAELEALTPLRLSPA